MSPVLPSLRRWRSAPSSWTRPAVVVAVSLLLLAAGAVVERVRFGADTGAALARVQEDLRRETTDRATRLRLLAERAASHQDIVGALTRPRDIGDGVFTAIERLVGPGAPADLAVTVYGADGQVVAWRGRPASLPPTRLAGGASAFVVPGPTGLRLVHVVPVVPDGGARRLGVVAAEQVIGSFTGVGGQAGEAHVQVGDVPVTILVRAVSSLEPSRGARFAIGVAPGDPLFTAEVGFDALDLARANWRATVTGLVVVWLALGLVSLAAAVVGTTRRRRRGWQLPTAVTLVLAARALLAAGVPTGWRTQWPAPEAVPDAPLVRALAGSPLDLLLSAVLTLGLVAVALEAVERWRLGGRARRRPIASAAAWTIYLAAQGIAGLVVAGLAAGYARLLQSSALSGAVTGLDLAALPGEPAHALAFTAIVLLQVALAWAGVVVVRAALGPWHTTPAGPALLAVTALAWLTGAALALQIVPHAPALSHLAVLLLVTLAGGTAWYSRRGFAWFRHGSQGSRIAALLAAVVLPTMALHPSLTHVGDRAREDAISSRFIRQVMSHPEELQALLNEALRQIDTMPALAELIDALPQSPTGFGTEAAFSVWQQTALAERRLTSAIELYGDGGRLVSRFALNFPEYASLEQHWQNDACAWAEVFGEAAPFGAEERRMLHAERAVCDAAGRPRGAIVVHVMLDYGALAFLSTQNPYAAVFGAPATPGAHAGLPGGDVSLTVYGWGRTPIYTSTGRAWPIAPEVFDRLYRSREPFWTWLSAGGRTDRVLFANDRYGIYAVGFPEITWFGHCVRLAELASFGAVTFLALYLAAAAAWRLAPRARGSGRSLAREIRTSFSRKLFLAFVGAAVVPVLVLAFSIRAFVASRLRAEVEAEAARTAAVAQRVIQETLATQRRDEISPTALTDDVMVWISRVIDQDVNIFVGTQVVATSERDLFASGLLPARVPGDVYRAIVVQRLPSYVTEDQIANLRYLMAAAPVRTGDVDAILTVPLALQQREIEREIDDLDRGVVLGVVVFVALGAGLGYWLAQRIADPVARLTRASHRIASGELSARVFVRSADELKRLVESFNSMAHELERQRAQLEHTNRLEAWAEMARQVAHDIKNPLTPIQLSAEHLLRVHRDRGEPLSPVLDRCVETILSQVRLLRRISSEFSSFATTPTVRPEPTAPAEMLREIVEHYRLGLEGRVAIDTDIADGLPTLHVDRLLIGRAVTNVVENALQAMPAGGSLHVSARVEDESLVIRVRDTGVGMDAGDTARAFDPSFSTKATGTGLGLPIAKRNVELHGGQVAVESAAGQGTTVVFRLPVTSRPA